MKLSVLTLTILISYFTYCLFQENSTVSSNASSALTLHDVSASMSSENALFGVNTLRAQQNPIDTSDCISLQPPCNCPLLHLLHPIVLAHLLLLLPVKKKPQAKNMMMICSFMLFRQHFKSNYFYFLYGLNLLCICNLWSSHARKLIFWNTLNMYQNYLCYIQYHSSSPICLYAFVIHFPLNLCTNKKTI